MLGQHGHEPVRDAQGFAAGTGLRILLDHPPGGAAGALVGDVDVAAREIDGTDPQTSGYQ